MPVVTFQCWFCFFLRFSHSPLIDEDDEEEEAKEPMLNEAFGKTYRSPALHCDTRENLHQTEFRIKTDGVQFSSGALTATEILFKMTFYYIMSTFNL